jgi:hypothetical protein
MLSQLKAITENVEASIAFGFRNVAAWMSGQWVIEYRLSDVDQVVRGEGRQWEDVWVL